MNRRLLIGAALCTLLAACGGGGDSTDSTKLAWGAKSYTLTRDPLSTSTPTLAGEVRASGPNFPAQMALTISPYGDYGGPTVGNGPFWVNASGVAPVTFSVPAGTAAGSYTFTASMTIGDKTYSDTTTLIVK